MPLINIYESSLATSEVYNSTINKTEDGVNLTQKVAEICKTEKHLTKEDIEVQYITVKQGDRDALTREAIKAFDDGSVVLIYNPNKATQVVQALPFITFKRGEKYITYVFMDKYLRIRGDGQVTLSASILRDLLISANISNKLKTNYATMVSDPFLKKALMDLYSEFFLRIINRLYSITPNKALCDIVKYYSNKFFLINVYGTGSVTNPEAIEKLASSHFKYANDLEYEDARVKYDEAAVSNIKELLNLIKDLNPRMNNLYLGNFLNEWISYYYPPAMLAIDDIEYFIFMVICLMSGGNGIISPAGSDAVKESKDAKNLKSELLKIVQ